MPECGHDRVAATDAAHSDIHGAVVRRILESSILIFVPFAYSQDQRPGSAMIDMDVVRVCSRADIYSALGVLKILGHEFQHVVFSPSAALNVTVGSTPRFASETLLCLGVE